MRVIAGRFKNRRISSIKAKWLRPTSDRVREIIFSLIEHRIEGTVFLDLYAGTGALGIEAFSRGAQKGTFVDRSASAIALIKSNLQQLEIEAECYKLSAVSFLRKAVSNNKQYDLIFCDPPYQAEEIVHILGLISAHNSVLKRGGLFILETSAKQIFKDIENLNILKQRVVGDTCITIYERVTL